MQLKAEMKAFCSDTKYSPKNKDQLTLRVINVGGLFSCCCESRSDVDVEPECYYTTSSCNLAKYGEIPRSNV